MIEKRMKDLELQIIANFRMIDSLHEENQMLRNELLSWKQLADDFAVVAHYSEAIHEHEEQKRLSLINKWESLYKEDEEIE